ncbi:toll/interleukin-1 receptor domain-containing protein [Methanosarcina barkeri]|uniref:TIR domain-containing protein n=1 Tax=Methanosarcina barkeri CM1 TaxID=796385 RepID=A0A0G3C989_METBA|nr:toll/interleukin-1 receptor domain-containing protein [Methanosarcina barkeri]AKJ38579.1 hypothetical protein MCM1_1539 [Methanosarcina barkeri CM1]
MSEEIDITESPWKGDKDEFRVFLSYEDSFHSETNQLATYLKFYGVDCFVAKYAPTPGEWLEQIKKALSTMDAFIPLITDTYHQKYWTNQEIGFAFAKEALIIPIKFESKNPEGFIFTKTAILSEWNTAPHQIVQELLKSSKSSKMIDALIKALEQNCGTFNQASIIKRLLDNTPNLKFSNQQAQNLIFAFYQNDQVGGCDDFCGKYQEKYGKPLIELLQRLTHDVYNIEEEGVVSRTDRAKRIKKVT